MRRFLGAGVMAAALVAAGAAPVPQQKAVAAPAEAGASTRQEKRKRDPSLPPPDTNPRRVLARLKRSKSDNWMYRINIPKALRHLGRREALRVMRGGR